MKAKQKQSPPPEPHSHGLVPELAKTLKQVGQHHYGLATAREFVPGGTYNRTATRTRYAKT